MKILKLRAGEQRRLKRGHLWIYSNEVADDLKEFEPGEAVTVLNANGKPIGSGTVNPHSLIAVRLHSRQGNVDLDQAFIERKLATAWQLRQKLGYTDVARVTHGEADSLPGLVIDRFGDILTVQHNSVGMDRRREWILEALDTLFSPRCVVAADDTFARELEGLPLERGIAGEAPDEIAWYTQDGLEWPVDLHEGQKTGGYLDQVRSRRLVAGVCRDARVLDGFCYTGGFGMLAAAHGAKEVVLADRSERALVIAREAFARNKLPAPLEIREDLLHGEPGVDLFGGPFDVTVVDPPPLVKNKAHLAEGLRKYETLFAQAIGWTKPEGLAAFFSCSHHVGREELLEQAKRAERRAHRRLRRLDLLAAGPDHPVLFGHPESEYLHGVLVEVG